MPKNQKTQLGDFKIRFANENDAATMVALIRDLAKYEKLLDKVEATAQQLQDSIFCHKAAEALIGEYKGEAVAYAIFFQNFSSFTARPGIYVEDIYVRPRLRRKGFGKALLAFIAKLAVERGCARMEWACLDWNAPSISFYKKIGAEALTDWTIYRLTGKNLEEASKEMET